MLLASFCPFSAEAEPKEGLLSLIIAVFGVWTNEPFMS